MDYIVTIIMPPKSGAKTAAKKGGKRNSRRNSSRMISLEKSSMVHNSFKWRWRSMLQMFHLRYKRRRGVVTVTSTMVVYIVTKVGLDPEYVLEKGVSRVATILLRRRKLLLWSSLNRMTVITIRAVLGMPTSSCCDVCVSYHNLPLDISFFCV